MTLYIKICVAQSGNETYMPGLSHFYMELQQAGEVGLQALPLRNKEKHHRAQSSGQGNLLDLEPGTHSCVTWPKIWDLCWISTMWTQAGYRKGHEAGVSPSRPHSDTEHYINQASECWICPYTALAIYCQYYGIQDFVYKDLLEPVILITTPSQLQVLCRGVLIVWRIVGKKKSQIWSNFLSGSMEKKWSRSPHHPWSFLFELKEKAGRSFLDIVNTKDVYSLGCGLSEGFVRSVHKLLKELNLQKGSISL